ncbi:MAG: capsule assembly Wzi family protein [candidate division KSB1 bacterium]|nr:capsule assembly Wzi family protein [candidate division KSB1 bacterium]
MLYGLVTVSQSQTVYVPADHWIYDFLDRLESKQVLPVVLNGTRPMTRAEIAEHLKAVINQNPTLDRVEREQLDFLRFEFQEELAEKADLDYPSRIRRLTKSRWIDPWLPDFIYPQGRHFLEIDHGPLKARWDPIFLRSRMTADDDTVKKSERVNIDTNGFLLWGTLGKWVGYYADVRDTREWGTRLYPGGNATAPRLGFVQGNTRQIYHDETIAYVTLQKRWALLMFGKDVNLWGPGRFGQLMLSDYATSYDQLKFQITLPRLKFTSMIAWLRAYSPDYYFGADARRMMAAHRLEFAPFRRFTLGLQETVLFSPKNLEAGYANPVMFFRSAEHYYGDNGNAAMGLDVKLKLIRNIKLYGELFIDDLMTGKLGTPYYGNKYGYTIGCHHADWLRVPQLDLFLEYSRIRPYTYSHKSPESVYQHFSTVLGHWIGPNSDLLTGSLTFRTSRRLQFICSTQYRRHGANPPDRNVGGDVDRPHQIQTDSLDAVFLDGLLNTLWSWKMSARYEALRNLYIKVGLGWEQRRIQNDSNENLQQQRRELELSFQFNF